MSLIPKNKMSSIPIFYIASMARSGETVFLRTLNSHTKIHVLHNIENRDSPSSLRLFERLKKSSVKEIAPGEVEHLSISSNQILIVKQGVYEAKSEFNGVVLVRNPLSIFASLISYDIGKSIGQCLTIYSAVLVVEFLGSSKRLEVVCFHG